MNGSPKAIRNNARLSSSGERYWSAALEAFFKKRYVGEKIASASFFLEVLKPEKSTDGYLDVSVPRMAIREKALGKIEINLAYVSSPLN